MSVVEPDLVGAKRLSAGRLCEAEERAAETRQACHKDLFRRIGTRDICTVTCQLSRLLHAGMPLVQALSALLEQRQSTAKRGLMGLRCEVDPLARILAEVRDSVSAGSSFADALGKYPRVFSPLMVNMVAAGEASGTLEQVLLRLAEMLEKRAQLVAKVKSAVAYPVMMIVVAVGVVVFLLSSVVPSITQIFLEMNRTLPWPTRLLMWTSDFVRGYLPLMAIAACAALFAVLAAYKTKEGRLFVDRTKLRLPLFGKLFLRVETARLARTLGMLLAGGIPIVRAVQIVRTVTQNTYIADALDSARDLVSRGESVADALKRTGIFAPVVVHIVATSQISATLEAGFTDIAEMYDGEVELTTKTLTSLLEPLILLVMGVVIGFIVLAVLLPIFEISQML